MEIPHIEPKLACLTIEEDEDRLSSLPNHILSHILSFAPTKYAVRTSVLSTRWRYLFLEVPKIIVDEQWLSRNIYKNRPFMEYVKKRLLSCIPSFSVTEFQLNCPLSYIHNSAVISRWIFLILSSKKVSVFQITGRHRFRLCNDFFRRNNLVVLRLHGNEIALKIPDVVSFPNLKVLDLKNLEVHSGNFQITKESYPVLEDLRLELITLRTIDREKSVFTVSSPTMKNLYLHLFDAYKVELDLYEFESLISANISIRYNRRLLNPGEFYLQILRRVTHVKELFLYEGSFLSEFSYERDVSHEARQCHLPAFPNLTHLTLEGYPESAWCLLQRAPNLESLNWTMSIRNPYSMEMSDVASLENLKEVTLKGNLHNNGAIEIVKFFLEHGSVLKKMKLLYLAPWELTPSWQSTLKQLQNLERDWPKCEIQVKVLREKPHKSLDLSTVFALL